MTQDGYIRYVTERGEQVKVANESVERASQARDMLRFTAIPSVDVDRRTVKLTCGARWMVYQIEEAGPAWRVAYVPHASRPMESLTGLKLLIDPWARELCDAALTAWLQASGRTSEGYYHWDYRGNLTPSGSIRGDITPEAMRETRALQRLDTRSVGVITATRREVARELAQMEMIWHS